MTTVSCDEARRLMRQALGDEADALPAALGAHCASCAECAAAWDAQRSVRALLAARMPEEVPAGFSARLEARLDALTPWWARIDWRWWTLRAAPLAAALLIGVAGATSVLEAPSSDTSSPVTVSTALWDESRTVSDDALLLAVLSGSADDEMQLFEESTP